MADAFLTAAGPAPARSAEDLWRQVALLGVSAAAYGGGNARVGMAAALLALDSPEEAAALARQARDAEPWARWWEVLAAGQREGAAGLAAALEAARSEPQAPGPDGREVTRRLADLEAELAELAGGSADGARFALLGHRPGPERRVLVGGRSSAAFLLDPRWEQLHLVRLAPSEGPTAGNRAHLPLAEVLVQVRRGEAGAGRPVPSDAPSPLQPAPMLEALREDPAARDMRLIALAREVHEERERLAGERLALEEERAALQAETARLRRVRAAANGARTAPPPPARPPRVPRTADEAAALLGVEAGASRAEVDRSWREQVVRCHPDRVEGMHPSIRKRAEDLTVALNAARDLLLGRETRRGAGG
jgi:DnaJ-domain-containing protein 1